MRPIILGVTKHARVEVRVMDRVRVRASKMQSKCREFGDVHQCIVCVAWNAISGESVLDQQKFYQGYSSPRTQFGPSGELTIFALCR